jgi:Tfp pilus assembly protein PilO
MQQHQQATLQDSIERQQQVVTALERYQAQIKEIQEILHQYFIHFPQKKQIPLLLERLIQSPKDGLIFHQIKLLPESHTTDYSVQPIEISMKGTYQGLTAFIEKMATFSNLITLHDFVIRPKLDPSQPYLQMTLEAKLYYINEDNHG